MSRNDSYRFSFGPWNIHPGADPFGPPVREEREFASKLKDYKRMGFEGVQFHDDDVVPADWDVAQTERGVAEMKKMLSDEGLVPEFVAPRIWEDPRTIDGAITSNSQSDRQYCIDRTKRCIDIAKMMDCNLIVLWPAREGTYLREAKDPVASINYIVEYLNMMLEYDKDINILGEMKPNEPMDQSYCPTVGHFMGLAYRTVDPNRVGVLIESAHSILAGLDPADDMAYALWHGKLGSVHLNDQNGLKYDQDRSFGYINLRRAFDQVDVLDQNGFGQKGEFVGLDVKALRTQKAENATKHLENSIEMFNILLQLSRSLDRSKIDSFRQQRDYESLENYLMKHLLSM